MRSKRASGGASDERGRRKQLVPQARTDNNGTTLPRICVPVTPAYKDEGFTGTLMVPELRNLCKERGLTMGKRDTEVDFQIALRGFEEFCRMQALIDDQEGDYRGDEDVDMKNEDEEGNALVMGLDMQQEKEEEDDYLSTGMRSLALSGSSVLFHNLSPKEFEYKES
ncbi:hypothetical protein NDU88_003823 [Pleurodeles waltl]|uniref:Uncharacterized protein n=1 Tax=Pleurodeles waltl TaxID=8319 RepID=A0AAV7V2L8_PLEWA|nr:hypothetical protein NDU88_003823 [Pleurodeles waltl]